MQIKLLHHTPLIVCSLAIRTCWDSHVKSDNGGEIDKELIYRVGNINKHKSTLEHLYYNFQIKDISRACLQELARHRIASLSVKSSRYTLKELKKESSFLPLDFNNIERAKKYLVFVESESVNVASIKALENLRINIVESVGNDVAKYCLPESYKTELVYSINARSLQNLLTLRSSKRALKEIRDLSICIYEALPKEHQYLFRECVGNI